NQCAIAGVPLDTGAAATAHEAGLKCKHPVMLAIAICKGNTFLDRLAFRYNPVFSPAKARHAADFT
ncbi:MAG: hypothetical protein JSU67_04405, partial [Gammaproteobacteria bacterium]